MIPVRDVIPTRTAPRATLALLATMGAACAWPQVRDWWLPWASDAVVLWLAGSPLEDRLGRGRFAGLVAGCAVAAAAAPAAAGWDSDPVWAASGAIAGVLAAYLVMFPTSRILTLVPVIIGVELVEVPAWAVFALWAALQAAAGWAALTWSAAADAVGMAISVAAGAVVGTLGGRLLPRPERMQVDWWDPPTSRS